MTKDRQIGCDDKAELERQAVAWLTRVTDDDATHEDRSALRRWQAKSPDHAAAFVEASRLWQAMPAAIESLVRAGDVSVPVAVDRRRSSVSRRAFTGGLASATAAGVGYLMVRPPLDLWPSLSELAADYRTNTGQQQRITIGAAVSVDMNTQTSIALRQDTSEIDRFELVSGEAIIGTAAGSAKSVQVIAADGSTTARVADFAVRRTATTACVTCLTGTVLVEHRDLSTTLQARQQVSYGEGRISSATLIDPADVISWREGYLMFRKEPLAHVIEEVNRYRPGRIVLLDPALGHGLVTARFKLDRLEDVVVQIREVFGAPVRSLPGGLVLVG
jgi:transmembrane sensor